MKNYQNLVPFRLHTDVLGSSTLETKLRFLLYRTDVKLVLIYKKCSIILFIFLSLQKFCPPKPVFFRLYNNLTYFWILLFKCLH